MLSDKKSVIVVGNAQPSKNLTSLIEAHDIVVRFNHVQYLDSSWVGHRTDILVVQNMDTRYKNGNATLEEWAELVVLSENPVKDYSEKIIASNKWKGRKYEVVYTDFLEIRKKLNATGGSSGISIIEWMLHGKKKEIFHLPINVVCFEWKGWSGHAWKEEKLLCYKYEEEGKIKIIR